VTLLNYSILRNWIYQLSVTFRRRIDLWVYNFTSFISEKLCVDFRLHILRMFRSLISVVNWFHIFLPRRILLLPWSFHFFHFQWCLSNLRCHEILRILSQGTSAVAVSSISRIWTGWSLYEHLFSARWVLNRVVRINISVEHIHLFHFLQVLECTWIVIMSTNYLVRVVCASSWHVFPSSRWTGSSSIHVVVVTLHIRRLSAYVRLRNWRLNDRSSWVY